MKLDVNKMLNSPEAKGLATSLPSALNMAQMGLNKFTTALDYNPYNVQLFNQTADGKALMAFGGKMKSKNKKMMAKGGSLKKNSKEMESETEEPNEMSIAPNIEIEFEDYPMLPKKGKNQQIEKEYNITINNAPTKEEEDEGDEKEEMAKGGMLKRKDGSYSKRGLWDNIRANAGSGKKPTKEMLAQEKKIKNKLAEGGVLGEDPNKPKPKYSWSSPTAPNTNVVLPKETGTSITTDSKAAIKYNENRKARETQERKDRIATANAMQKSGKQFGSTENYAIANSAIGDKLRFSAEPNIVDDYLNPAAMIGDMASGLATVPDNLKKGNYGQAALAVAAPLATGALAGIGANNTGQFVNNLVNPLTGLTDGAFKLTNKTGEFLTTKTPLKNTYKYNPWAFKSQQGKIYRQVGKSGFDDAIMEGKIFDKGQKQFLEDNPSINYLNEYNDAIKTKGVNLKKPSPAPFFSKDELFFPIDRKATGKGFKKTANSDAEYLIEGSVPDEALLPRYMDKYLKPEEKINTFVLRPEYNDLKNFKIYKRDWLKGYKEVPKPQINKNVSNNIINPSVEFKSEIDWSKWNPDTPKYPELINEYNAIEESTKKAGTWMKNPDGSAFQGTPEQFIQQNSKNFKKAFPDYYGEMLNHNSNVKFDTFNNKFFGTETDRGWYGEGIYTHPSEKYTQEYGINNYKLYTNSKNKGFINKDNYNASKSYNRNYNRELENLEKTKKLQIKEIHDNPKDYEDVEFWKNAIENKYNKNKKKLIEEQQEGLKHNINQYSTLTNPQNGEVVIPFNNPVKSAVGNVGFFDMTNPNIFKNIASTGLTSAGLLKAMQSVNKGKEKPQMAEGGTLEENPGDGKKKRPTIYVEPNTEGKKKYQMYKDSLNLYNKTKDIENPKYYTDGNPSWYNWKGNLRDAKKFMIKNNIDLNYEYYRTGKFPGKIQPVNTGDFGEGMAYPIYKKPEQPIAFKIDEINSIPSLPINEVKLKNPLNLMPSKGKEFTKQVNGVSQPISESMYNNMINNATSTEIIKQGKREMAEGGKLSPINIKPENRGKFTAAAERRDMGVQEFASKVLANKEDYSPTMVKRANFAKNAASWQKADGGTLEGPSHENGGINVNSQGMPTTESNAVAEVEGGEYRYKDPQTGETYIFSNRLPYKMKSNGKKKK